MIKIKFVLLLILVLFFVPTIGRKKYEIELLKRKYLRNLNKYNQK